MKILFISHYFPPEGNAPATRVHAMCKRWVAAGHQVQVITGVPNVPNGIVYSGYRNRWVQRETIDGIDVCRVWTHVAANRGRIKRVLNYLSFMVMAVVRGLCMKRPDVVVATSPQFFCGWAGAMVSRLRCLPFVLEIRDLWPDSIRAVGAIRNERVLSLLESLEKAMYRTADHVVTVGEGYRKNLIEKGVPNPTVIHNGIDPDVYRPMAKDPDVVKQFGLEGKFVCGYVGTIGMASGLEVLLDAADKLKKQSHHHVRFLLIGDGASRQHLEEQARRRGLDNVVFAGRIDKAWIPKMQSVCDCSIIHLRKDPLFETVLPSKMFEAMAMAHPIVLGVRGDASKLLEKARAGISVEPENEHAMVRAILELSLNAGRRQAMGQSGRAYVMEEHALDGLAGNYLQRIEQVLDKTHRSGVAVGSSPSTLDWYAACHGRLISVDPWDIRQKKSA